MPWYQHNETLFHKEIKLLKEYYPSLKFYQEDSKIYFRGLLNIEDIDSFEIEILLPDDYPKSLPIVKDIGNDIPRNIDRHMYSDGTCCLTINHVMIQKYQSDNYYLLNFIDDFVKPFFANQLYFEQTGKWLTGEYSHGNTGKREYLKEYIQITDDVLFNKLLNLATKTRLNQRKKCPCYSNKPLKRCHLQTVLEIKRLLPYL